MSSVLSQVGRRTIYLAIALLAILGLMLMAERDYGAAEFLTSPISNGNTCCGIPSNGKHNGPDDHCNDGKGKDKTQNKHCLSANPSP